jgi:hypothetical protein
MATIFGAPNQAGCTQAQEPSLAAADQPTKQPANAPPAVSTPPFINGHYVLKPTMKMNDYHSNEPIVVVVDKNSHYTHVLQLQGDEIVRVYSVHQPQRKTAEPP